MHGFGIFTGRLLVDIWTKCVYGRRRMDGELRVGIVGTGFIGGVHARSLRVAGIRLAGVASASLERAESASGAYAAQRAYASAEELIGDPSIDAVHTCTPNHLYVP